MPRHYGASRCLGEQAEEQLSKLTTNTNQYIEKGDKDCHGGLQSYSCADFKPASTSLKQDHEDAAKAAAEPAALEIAAKAIVWNVIRLVVQNLWCRPP